MAPKLSVILDGLQQQVLLLNELVARVAALPPADNQPWAALSNKLQQLYSDFAAHIAIVQLLLSRSTEDERELAELDALSNLLQTNGQLFEALRVAPLSAPSNQATEGTPDQNTTSLHTTAPVTVEQLEHVRISLRAAMASLFLSSSRGAETIPPTHSPSTPESSTLQATFSLRPFALTGADISLLAPPLDDQDLKTVVESISSQVDAVAKEWVQRQTAVACAIEPSVLTHFWLGNTPKASDERCGTEIPVGNLLKRFTSTRNSVALVGHSSSGKSAMINAIVGVHLITSSSKCYCCPLYSF